MKKNSTTKRSRAKGTRTEAKRAKGVDLSDIPEITPKQFAQGVVRRGLKPVEPKVQITVRVDRDVIEWFREQGKGYQTRINALLRAYMEAHTARARPD